MAQQKSLELLDVTFDGIGTNSSDTLRATEEALLKYNAKIITLNHVYFLVGSITRREDKDQNKAFGQQIRKIFHAFEQVGESGLNFTVEHGSMDAQVHGLSVFNDLQSSRSVSYEKTEHGFKIVIAP